MQQSVVRVGLCQVMVTAHKPTNLAAAAAAVRDVAAQGAQLVMLPEVFNGPYSNDSFPEFAEPLEGGESVALVRELAREHGVWLVGGSIPERDGDRLYNTSVVANPDGDVVAVHRKVHLFDIDVPGGITFKESDTLSPGARITAFDTPFGRVGLGICYDMRFAEYAQALARDGCDVLCYPGAFNTVTGPAHWELLQRARAVDNQTSDDTGDFDVALIQGPTVTGDGPAGETTTPYQTTFVYQTTITNTAENSMSHWTLYIPPCTCSGSSILTIADGRVALDSVTVNHPPNDNGDTSPTITSFPYSGANDFGSITCQDATADTDSGIKFNMDDGRTDPAVLSPYAVCRIGATCTWTFDFNGVWTSGQHDTTDETHIVKAGGNCVRLSAPHPVPATGTYPETSDCSCELTANDCYVTTPVFNQASCSCDPCAINDECPGASVCNTGTGACDCSTPPTCTEGQHLNLAACVCDQGCTSDSDCANQCNTNSGDCCPSTAPEYDGTSLCVCPITSNTDCTDSTKLIADTSACKCVQCLADTDCSGNKVCNADKTCECGITTDTDCTDSTKPWYSLTTPIADVDNCQCVGCLVDTDCDGTTTCTSTNVYIDRTYNTVRVFGTLEGGQTKGSTTEWTFKYDATIDVTYQYNDGVSANTNDATYLKYFDSASSLSGTFTYGTNTHSITAKGREDGMTFSLEEGRRNAGEKVTGEGWLHVDNQTYVASSDFLFIVDPCVDDPPVQCQNGQFYNPATQQCEAGVPAPIEVAASACEDSPATATVTAIDVDDSTLTLSIVGDASQAGKGTVAVSGMQLVFTPVPNWNSEADGPATFFFEVCDDENACALGTAKFTIHPENDMPVQDSASSTSSAIDEDPENGVVPTIDMSAGWSDIETDADALIFECSSVTFSDQGDDVTEDPTVYTCTSTGTFDITLPHNWNGVITIVYNVTDTAQTSVGDCDASQNTAQGTCTLTVNAVNDAPTAGVDEHEWCETETSPFSFTLTASDPVESDPIDWSTVEFRNVPESSTAAIPIDCTSAPTCLLTDTADQNTVVEWRVKDNPVDTTTTAEFSAWASLTLNVYSANTDAPATSGDIDREATANEDDVDGQTRPTTVDLSTGWTDADPAGGALTFTCAAPVISGSGGTAPTVTAVGSTDFSCPNGVFAIDWSSSENWYGTVSVSYTVTDEADADNPTPASFTRVTCDGSAQSTDASYTLTVNAVNDPRVPQPVSGSTCEDTLSDDITFSVTDVDSTDMDWTTLVTDITTQGTLSLSSANSGKTATFKFMPADDFSGTINFKWSVSDTGDAAGNAGVTSVTDGDGTIVVLAMNDAPEAINPQNNDPSVVRVDVDGTEDVPIEFGKTAIQIFNEYFTDVDQCEDPSYVISSEGMFNVTEDAETGVLTATPEENRNNLWNTSASVTITYTDTLCGSDVSTCGSTTHSVSITFIISLEPVDDCVEGCSNSAELGFEMDGDEPGNYTKAHSNENSTPVVTWLIDEAPGMCMDPDNNPDQGETSELCLRSIVEVVGISWAKWNGTDAEGTNTYPYGQIDLVGDDPDVAGICHKRLRFTPSGFCGQLNFNVLVDDGSDDPSRQCDPQYVCYDIDVHCGQNQRSIEVDHLNSAYCAATGIMEGDFKVTDVSGLSEVRPFSLDDVTLHVMWSPRKKAKPQPSPDDVLSAEMTAFDHPSMQSACTFTWTTSTGVTRDTIPMYLDVSTSPIHVHYECQAPAHLIKVAEDWPIGSAEARWRSIISMNLPTGSHDEAAFNNGLSKKSTPLVADAQFADSANSFSATCPAH